ncbi:putative carboxyl-terminal proteinase protein [Phaeoacremonium minimum UCRPA7]|uniref:Putative carboxyl-terminal proteinase protein n=1 Tax=Phaeoacremonium minimum (strain UCR-PA7) TaxID=1286976 RepID=R8BGH5_PHAM7|nr:putative carboxyl-terminal proteinase protein [Phaeoacremonium minimum UCRPA7]EON98440.1 putative carboxyl-terminal proteinase protein [Phaeoacremonium minimum UCRPA7]
MSLKSLLLGSLLSSFVVQAVATPVIAARGQYAKDALRKRANLNVKRTTTTDTTTIDWVPIDSQGKIATPPPNIVSVAATNASKPISELQQPGAEVGPPGTVPIPQVDPDYLANVAEKGLPEIRSAKAKRQYAGNHWYVTSNQNVANWGGKATYSVYKAFVNNGGDFSLLQTAVVKSNTNGGQTLEAGWINYPNQVSQPHLFTYYTTNGYSSQGDNVGGWNQDVAGWVQYDSEIFPGTVFSPNSVDGGAQYEIEIQYLLYQGNWWLWVLDRWIGYYPASLFSNGISGVTLATGSDMIFYYGEIYQSEGPLTTTDMGSGEFGTTGFGHSAYIHNMVYTDTTGSTYYDYTASFGDSDSARYNHQNVASSGTNWGSYVYLGGPGAGGVVGG